MHMGIIFLPATELIEPSANAF